MSATSVAAVEQYDYDIIKKFSVMAIVWAVVGMLAGVYIASELAWPFLNFDSPVPLLWPFSPGAYRRGDFRLWRLARCSRPPITWCSAPARPVCFAPAWRASPSGAGRRSSCWPRCRMCWAISQGREYAEMEWPIDLLIAVVWVAYAVVFIGTLMQRKQPHIYVANWFYLPSSWPPRCCTPSTTWRCRSTCSP